MYQRTQSKSKLDEPQESSSTSFIHPILCFSVHHKKLASFRMKLLFTFAQDWAVKRICARTSDGVYHPISIGSGGRKRAHNRRRLLWHVSECPWRATTASSRRVAPNLIRTLFTYPCLVGWAPMGPWGGQVSCFRVSVVFVGSFEALGKFYAS